VVAPANRHRHCRAPVAKDTRLRFDDDWAGNATFGLPESDNHDRSEAHQANPQEETHAGKPGQENRCQESTAS
jgi:hypothetical protein